MARTMLRDDQWERIGDLCSGKASDRGVTAKDNRLFVEAVLWIARTGSPWRDLPKQFGHWHSVYMRFSRWSKKGVWARLAEELAKDPDLEVLFIDSTIVRAHQHATGALKKRPASHRPLAGWTDDEDPRRSRGLGQSAARALERWRGRRYSRGASADQGRAGTGRGGRQRL